MTGSEAEATTGVCNCVFHKECAAGAKIETQHAGIPACPCCGEMFSSFSLVKRSARIDIQTKKETGSLCCVCLEPLKWKIPHVMSLKCGHILHWTCAMKTKVGEPAFCKFDLVDYIDRGWLQRRHTDKVFEEATCEDGAKFKSGMCPCCCFFMHPKQDDVSCLSPCNHVYHSECCEDLDKCMVCGKEVDSVKVIGSDGVKEPFEKLEAFEPSSAMSSWATVRQKALYEYDGIMPTQWIVHTDEYSVITDHNVLSAPMEALLLRIKKDPLQSNHAIRGEDMFIFYQETNPGAFIIVEFKAHPLINFLYVTDMGDGNGMKLHIELRRRSERIHMDLLCRVAGLVTINRQTNGE